MPEYDGVHWTCLNAERAADARLFVDDRHLLRLLLGDQWFDLAPEQICQLAYAVHAARGTEVDFCFAGRDRLGVGLAARVTTLAALRLRQNGIDLFDQRVTLDLELDRGVNLIEA